VTPLNSRTKEIEKIQLSLPRKFNQELSMTLLVCFCRNLLAGIAFLLCFSLLPAQNRTVGLFTSTPDAFPGYTLYSPLLTSTHYLIDNCGNVVHRWETDRPLGNSMYLLDDGRLLKTALSSNVNSTITGAGGGEEVQIIGWDAEVLWRYNPTTDSLRLHHDIEPLPNGNILMIAWEAIGKDQAIAAGRDTALLVQDAIWSEMLMEVKPSGPESGEIVWEWHLWDHLVQDYDSLRANYGVPGDHPELLDLNFVNNFIEPIGEADWVHLNSVDYNPELDQIVLSSQRLSEVYILDHSTTTAEAATHSGGRSGRGGDFVYRWGNPQAYRAGLDADQQLFGQHNARWITPGLRGAGNIMIFNNGNTQERPWSTVIEIDAPLLADGNYARDSARAFGPELPAWSYAAPSPADFFSWFISGSQRLPNGNTLVCSGAYGTFFEIDENGQEVWRYVNPVTGGGIISQGDTIPDLPFAPANLVFRAERYAEDFPGFGGRDLSSQGLLELNPLPDSCRSRAFFPVSALIYPNPAREVLNIDLENVFGNFATLRIYNLQGQLVWEDENPAESNRVDLSKWNQGMYILRIGEYGWKRFVLAR
jgi:hypothetical protein